MTRLFAIRSPKGELVKAAPNLNPFYFTNKKAAKHVRDQLNEDIPEDGERYTIARGPDHWRGRS